MPCQLCWLQKCHCPAAPGQVRAAASLPAAQQVLEGWMSCFQKHLQVPAAFTEQLDRANEGTALIKQPPFCFMPYGVPNKWWGVLGIGKVEVVGCFPSPPFSSVSKAFQQQEEEVQLPLVGLAGEGNAACWSKDKHRVIWTRRNWKTMLKTRPSNSSSRIPDITYFPLETTYFSIFSIFSLYTQHSVTLTKICISHNLNSGGLFKLKSFY